MDYVYAVCGDTMIDGGAPGYFALCICQSEEEANKYLQYFEDRYDKFRCDEFEALIETPYKLGYVESYPRHFWIKKVALIDSINFTDVKKFYENNASRIRKRWEE